MNASPDTNRAFTAGGAFPMFLGLRVKGKVRVKFNVKGSGQECPLHTIKISAQSVLMADARKQVPRLRIAIDKANRNTALGMTILVVDGKPPTTQILGVYWLHLLQRMAGRPGGWAAGDVVAL
jgi:hypothetical protein